MNLLMFIFSKTTINCRLKIIKVSTFDRQRIRNMVSTSSSPYFYEV